MPRVVRIDPARPDPALVREAADLLRGGGLVALPTETVYGLAAHALDVAAVARIFAAKGRPSSNPLIVHVASAEGAAPLVAEWPERAARLAERFWPGPLTMVLPKSNRVPDVVTARGPTVAVRAPAHPVALAILREAGVPLAAPSANVSNAVSPTTAAHVVEGLGDRVDLVVDGGPCEAGIESTVLQLATEPPCLLRPGTLSLSELERVVGPIARDRPVGGPLPSPGLLARHYAPRAKLELRDDDRARVEELVASGERVAWLSFDVDDAPDGVLAVQMPREARAYASRLYATLHDLDARGITRIVAAQPPEGDDWLGVRDRLKRASS